MANIKCKHCGHENIDTAKFCSSCGKQVEGAGVDVVKTEAIIKCGNCGYVGHGESARKLIFNILAWICVFFAPLITIIYFVGTHKYRCPKCKSTFVGVKDKYGNFGSPRGSRVLVTIVVALLAIALIGILSSVVLVSLNTARQKGKMAQISATFKCPEDYSTDQERNDAWQKYASAMVDANPDMSASGFADARATFLIQHNCTQTLQYIDDNGGMTVYKNSLIQMVTK